MINERLLAVGFFLIGFLVFSGCAPQTVPEVDVCDRLQEKFDKHVGTMDRQKCQEYDNRSLMVGGVLHSITTTYEDDYYRYTHKMLFNGSETQKTITIHTKNKANLPYEEGTYYEFDLRGNCYLLDSSASSGAYFDPELDAFKPKQDC